MRLQTCDYYQIVNINIFSEVIPGVDTKLWKHPVYNIALYADLSNLEGKVCKGHQILKPVLLNNQYNCFMIDSGSLEYFEQKT